MKVFIINIPESTTRREDIKKQLTKYSLDFEFIPAFDGRKMSEEEKNAIYDGEIALGRFGREMKNGEIGCARSHRMVYEKMLAEDIPEAIVLEDDVVLYDVFEETVMAIQAAHFKNTVIKLENSIAGLRMSIWHNRRFNRKYVLRKPSLKKCFNTAGYFLDKEAAVNLLGESKKIVTVIDEWCFYARRVRIRILCPGILEQRAEAKSDIWQFEDKGQQLSSRNLFLGSARLDKCLRIVYSLFIRFLP